MYFKIKGPIREIEIIATGHGIRRRLRVKEDRGSNLHNSIINKAKPNNGITS